jgi:hypothetical protein
MATETVRLPKELQYNKYYKLPQSVQCISMATNALNNNAGAGEKLEFDFVSRGKMVPNTLWLQYELVPTGQTIAGALIRGIPFYAPLSQSSLLIGSQRFDTQNSYNAVCSALVDLKMNSVQKLAQARNLGIDGTQSILYGGSTSTSGVGLDYAGPLPNMLSNASNQIPLAWMPQVRLELTLAALSEVFVVLAATSLPTSYSIRNAIMHYDIIEYGDDYDREILASMLDENGKLNIKTMSYATSGQVISVGSSGNLEYVFNTRFGSIKSLFAFFPPTNNTSAWQQFESFDPTNASGEISFSVAGIRYPQRPISTAINKNAVIPELILALNGSQHILSAQFSNDYAGWILNNGATTTNTVNYPNTHGTFIFGSNVERLSSNDVLLSGINTQSSPITVNLNFTTATTVTQSVRLTVMFDAVFQIDPMSKTCQIIQ